jgi:hypothetical protein
VAELSDVPSLAESPGADRQRAMAERVGIDGLVEALSREFLGLEQTAAG